MQIIPGNFDQVRKAPPPAYNDADGQIVALSWYQDCTEKMLMCQYCNETWLDIIPVTMPAHQLECEACLQKGHVTDFIPRRLR